MNSKYAQQFKRGSLEMILLCLIEDNETYGYEIMSNLNEKGGDIFGYAKEGTIYPLLYRLESAELVTTNTVLLSDKGAKRKVYALTEKGRETLAELKNFWADYVKCVNQFIYGENEQ